MFRRILFLGFFLSKLCYSQTAVELPHPAITLIDALRSTLSRNPQIQIADEQLNISRGALQIAQSQFDTTLNASYLQNHVVSPLTNLQKLQYAQLGLDFSSVAANTTTYYLAGTKEFRNGIAFSPNLTLNRNTDNIASRNGLSQSNLAFQVVIPILRGRGRAAVDAQEQSARTQVDASLNSVNQQIALLLTTTAIDYWNIVAAEKSLEIARASEERGKHYVEDVQTLIDADRVPKAEINQLLGNLAGRTATRIGAEQSVISAQQAFSLSIGLGADEMAVLPEVTEDLPDWPDKPAPQITLAVVRDFAARALVGRPNYAAADLQRRAAEQLIPAARNQLLPQLNASVSTGYNGLVEGTSYSKPFASAFNNVGGINVVGSINLSVPFRNDYAHGQLTEATAASRQAAVAEADLARNISSSVITGMTTLVSSINGLHKAHESVTYYRKALTGEQEKFRLGLNYLVDVLNMEDRLTGALTTELSAKASYANALASLRYATGTVIDRNETNHTLKPETFLQLPFDWSH